MRAPACAAGRAARQCYPVRVCRVVEGAGDGSGGVRIDHRDDKGRLLKPKEVRAWPPCLLPERGLTAASAAAQAFRHLSHKFHGHGPSKKKLEKKERAILIDEQNKKKSKAMTTAQNMQVV